MADAEAARAKVAELFPAARVICSAVPEVAGTRRIEEVRDPHELNDVDVGVVRSPLAVAEAGAVGSLRWNGCQRPGVLSQHLVVLLDPAAIVDTPCTTLTSELDLAASPYGLFWTSATGDARVIIPQATGARA